MPRADVVERTFAAAEFLAHARKAGAQQHDAVRIIALAATMTGSFSGRTLPAWASRLYSPDQS